MTRECIYSRAYHQALKAMLEIKTPEKEAYQLARAAGNAAVADQHMGKHEQGTIIDIDL